MVCRSDSLGWRLRPASTQPPMQILPGPGSFYSCARGRRHRRRAFHNNPGQNATVSREASVVAFKGISQPPAAAMTIAELPGFDMSLLWKLSVSAAAVLLVSWAYRFYCSKDARGIRGNAPKPANATCQNCKTALNHPRSAKHEPGEEDRQPGPSRPGDQPPSDGSGETRFLARRAEKDGLDLSCCDGKAPAKDETPSHRECPKVTDANASLGSPLTSLHHSTERGPARTTGRHPSCRLQNVGGIVGVRRELRQESECQGAYSSFLSKAEIKVEDAAVPLKGTGDQRVRRKIYDYYVESSSHCVTEPDRVLGHCESQPAHLRSLPLPSSSVGPLTVRDLILPQSTSEDSSVFEAMKPKHPPRPALLRKQSYLSATARCELSIPPQTSRATAALPQSPASNGSESTSAPAVNFSCEGSGDPEERDGREAETVAESPLARCSPSKLECAVLEKFKGKIDLGNCLEALDVAKKYRQTSLQQAALGVMSDNYLQVLRDPSIYGRLLAGERDQIQKQRMRGTRFVMVAHIHPQDGSRTFGAPAMEKEQTASGAIYHYDDHADTWHRRCLIPQEIVSKACAVCTMDNYLFVAVGCQAAHNGTAPSKRVFCFNPLTSIWKEISPMNEARPCCKLAALEGYIYAIGGECLSSVERYDPREDKWTFVAPLPNNTFAVAHQVAVSNGEIYVSGGTFKYMLLCYSPKSDSWRSSLLVGSKDRTADMVAVKRCLYRFDMNPILGVSVYRYHTGVRLWYKCCSRRLLRCPAFHCVALEDTIFCIGHQFTVRFLADEISPAFGDEHLSVLSAAKGMLFPFVLSLPDKKPLQTSV